MGEFACVYGDRRVRASIAIARAIPQCFAHANARERFRCVCGRACVGSIVFPDVAGGGAGARDATARSSARGRSTRGLTEATRTRFGFASQARRE